MAMVLANKTGIPIAEARERISAAASAQLAGAASGAFDPVAVIRT